METPDQPTTDASASAVQDTPLLKQKRTRKMTDEQRKEYGDRMRIVNENRVKNSKRVAEKEKELQRLIREDKEKRLDEKIGEVVSKKAEPSASAVPVAAPKKKTKKPSVKVIEVQSSGESESEDSDDESIPEAKYVVINKQPRKSKSITKQKAERTEQAPPVPIPKPLFKFL